MDHTKLGPRCVELSILVQEEPRVELISQFLDGDAELKEYLRLNKSFHYKDFSGWANNCPPHHMAVFYGREEILHLFLTKYGVSPDARNTWAHGSITVLHWAISFNEPHWVRVLLEHGANVSLGGKLGLEFDNALGLVDIYEEASEEIKQMLRQAIQGEAQMIK